MISVESVPEPDAVDAFEDGLIVPVPGTDNNSIVLEVRDGSSISQLVAGSVTLQQNGRVILRCREVRISVYVTDARLAFACSKYDKGGGWIGGGTALVFNSVSKARAAYRRRGKMLVGQARYPWIQRVGSTPKSGFGTEERLVIDERGGDGTNYRLTLGLPKNLDAARVASTVAQRAATFRLACGPKVDESVGEKLRRLTTAGPLPPDSRKNHIVFHEIPGARPVDPTSARFSPRRGVESERGAIPPPPPPPPPVDLGTLTGTSLTTPSPNPSPSTAHADPDSGQRAPSRLKGRLASQPKVDGPSSSQG